MLYAACDAARYELLGAGPSHRSCAANLRQAPRDHGIEAAVVPQPLNVFTDVQAQQDGTLVSVPASLE